jgi:hypothetical protein
MKHKLFYFLILSIFLSSCISDKLDDRPITADIIAPENPPSMKFELDVFDFDTIALGSSVSYTFKFENLGPSPLLIHSVKAACGCTVLKEWPKQPIMVGEVGEIPIEFTSKKSGFTKKYISILANTKPATTKLYLQGHVSGI